MNEGGLIKRMAMRVPEQAKTMPEPYSYTSPKAIALQ